MTAILCKLICLVIGVFGFYYGRKADLATGSGYRGQQRVLGGIFAGTGIVTLFSLCEWGYWGLLAIASPFLGIFLNIAFTDWGTQFIEWLQERRGLAADVYMKLDEESKPNVFPKFVLVWPITPRAKKDFTRLFSFPGSGFPKKRGAMFIPFVSFEHVLNSCNREHLAVIEHSDLVVAHNQQKGES